MKKQHILFAVIFFFFIFVSYSNSAPRISPLGFYERLNIQGSELTDREFIEAALWASESDNINSDYAQISDLIARILGSINVKDSNYDKGESILVSLHDLLFTRYDEDQTEIDLLLNSGVYNCVSSAVLYTAIGRAAGLDIQGVKTTDHAFVSLIDDGKVIDIETTNLWGFDPGQKKEFTDSFSGSTGYNYVPPGNYRLRQNISDAQLVGLILQNRIAELQRRNDHRETVPLAVDRYVLTGSEESKKDMFDTFSNYSALLNDRAKYEEGIEFLRLAIGRWGSNEKVESALHALVHNYVLFLLDDGRSVAAEEFIEEISRTGFISSEAEVSTKTMVYDRRTVDFLNSDEPFSIVQNYLDKVLGLGYLSNNKWLEYTQYNYIREAEKIANSSGWLEAYLFVRDAPEELKTQRKFRQLLESCKGNYVVTVHNRFADLYNSGNYSEAESIILEGLEVLPQNETLLSDLSLINKKSSR